MKRIIPLFIILMLTSAQVKWEKFMCCLAGGPGYQGPADVIGAANVWYGFRAYSHALANAGASTTKVADVFGNVTTTQCTIFLKGDGTGDVDLTTAGVGGAGNQCLLGATTFCTVTNASCTISKFYDQSGNGSNATPGSNPANSTLTFNAIGTKPGMSCVLTNTDTLGNTTMATAAQPWTFSTVVQHSDPGLGNAWVAAKNGIWAFGVNNPALTGQLFAGSVNGFTSSFNVWHAWNLYGSGASSFINNDGTETSVSIGTNSLSQPFNICTDDALDLPTFIGIIEEVGFWPNGLSTSTTRNNQCQNQQAYYGSGNFGAAC